ncbi:eukaryotic translation initiation factor 3 subunit B-like [Aegilops tauschii subsp. strangulata]|uniref:Eukaryotic translation initiation factor 3 subunit B n=1 Tax=Aegilops tauschii TaxID=37682 RepID=R7WF12_AEGTA
MHWQNNGEYLAIQVDRYAESENTTCTSFELFMIMERGIPVFELDTKNDNIIVVADCRRSQRRVREREMEDRDLRCELPLQLFGVSVIMQTLMRAAGKEEELITPSHDARPDYLTIIAFALEPNGCQFAVIHGDEGTNGQLEFYTVDDLETMTTEEQLEFYNVDDLEVMATEEHSMVIDVMWDPTGSLRLEIYSFEPSNM